MADRFRLPFPDGWSVTSGEAVERMRAVAEATCLRIPVEQAGDASERAAELWATWEALGLIALLRPHPSRRRRLWLWLTGWWLP